MTKVKVMLSLDPKKAQELRTKAADMGISLSSYLTVAGSIAFSPVVENRPLNSVAGSVTQQMSDVFEKGFELPVTEQATGEWIALNGKKK